MMERFFLKTSVKKDCLRNKQIIHNIELYYDISYCTVLRYFKSNDDYLTSLSILVMIQKELGIPFFDLVTKIEE
jgi:hypothetical protein